MDQAQPEITSQPSVLHAKNPGPCSAIADQEIQAVQVGVATRARMSDFERSKRHRGDFLKSHIPSHTKSEI